MIAAFLAKISICLRALSFIFALLWVFTRTAIAQNQIYFFSTQPEVFSGLSVTPDEQLVVVKSNCDVVVLDRKTGQRIHRWVLPRHNVSVLGSQSFYSPFGRLLDLLNDFLTRYGPDVHLLNTDTSSAKGHYQATGESYGGYSTRTRE